jgi:hypothetical protein
MGSRTTLLHYSPLQLAQEAEYIDHRIELIRDYLPTVVTREDDWQGLRTFKVLFSKPSLTAFSFSKEVCVYLSARDDFDLLVHLTYEWEAGQFFYITVLFN